MRRQWYMRQSIFRFCAPTLLGIVALAQQAPLDPAIVIGSLDKQMAPLASVWMHSVDPRIRAWAAYVVLRDRRTEAIPELLAMVAEFPVTEEVVTQTDVDQHDAMLGVLDALIQFGAQVPAGDAQRIYPEFPVQSLILLARSQEDTTPAFLQFFKSERRWPAAWLTVGALLMERRAEGFSEAVVEGMTVRALVIVTEPGSGSGVGGSSICCTGSGLPRLKDGWPPVGVYAFDSCGDRLRQGAMVLAGGTDPAYYSRQVTATYQSAGGSGCGCNPDQDVVREHYLTKLLFDSSEQPPVRAHVSHTITWQGLGAYRSELGKFIGQQKHILAALAWRLGEQGLLSEADVKSIRPRLEIRVWDQRATRVPALTADVALEGNVTIEWF